MKEYKCKYCGARIQWERDANGRSHAVERNVYYTPDPLGNLLILTMRGDIVRAVEDLTSDKVGLILHRPRCEAPPKFITSNKKKSIEQLPTVPAAISQQQASDAAPAQQDIRTSLFK